MNRKQKIIVSVTGIFIVLLIIVGLTYAYFLTQIKGNTNNKSISIETANLELVYGDGTTELLTSSTKLVPSSNPINTKDFTVENKGDDTNYAVIIENVRVKDATTGELTTFDSNDFKYTLSCTKEDGTSCNGVSTQTTLPMSDNILVENDIDSGDTHTYVITVWYLDNGNDQSSDMNKTLEARINIEDSNRINPYSNKSNSLAYNIINNALNVNQEELNNGYAVYRSTPLTIPAKEISAKYVAVDPLSYEDEIMDFIEDPGALDYYYIYSDSFTINNAGMYLLTNPKIVKYSEGYKDLRGKYIEDIIGFFSDEEPNKYVEDREGSYSLYKVSEDANLTRMPCGEVKTYTESLESTLSLTEDDYTSTTGNMSYYFRGDVKNNYIEYNGMCWRIVRVEGDGSVKITLAKQGLCSTITSSDTTSSFISKGDFGYTDMENADYGENKVDYENDESTSSMKYVFNKFLNGGEVTYQEYSNGAWNNITHTFNPWSESVLSKLKANKICIGDNKTKYNYNGTILKQDEIDSYFEENEYFPDWYYKNYLRIAKNEDASMICDENEKTKNNYKIFTLTADEIIFAGSKYNWRNVFNDSYYLKENSDGNWWTTSIYNFEGGALVGDTAFYVDFHDNIGAVVNSYDGVYQSFYLRPAISLIPGIELASDSGNGTQMNPYKVKVN